MNYTPNHHMPQWVSSDRVRMEDFNQMSLDIEAGLEANAAAASAAQSAAANAYSPDNKPFAVGSYTGDGSQSQRITLGFEPSLVIVSGMTETADVNDFSTIAPYFAITADNTNVRRRVQIHKVGFTVYIPGNYEQQLPNLNVRGRHYDYIAFR